MKITTLLIDLGGVLVDLRWRENVSALLQRDVPFEQLHQAWISSKAAKAFETGQSDFNQFISHFQQEFSITKNEQEIQKDFMQMLAGPKAGAKEILTELKKHYRLAVLSNTNPPHISEVRENYGLLEHFDDIFLSFEMGCMKPDPEIYLRALEHMAVEPGEVCFFDDGLINVEAAKSLGMHSFQVFSPEEIQQSLQTFK
ncbi:HAD family hydrolase [Gynuella sp.]|uniref:HAD family hydrolase n=1 Tax=Gynuella sp. TaxID=2969146 RepID=UPI003D11A859